MVSGIFSLPLTDAAAGPREFLAGQENALVRVAQRAVLQPDCTLLPLVLYGVSGTGKTLLAQGLAQAWQQAQPHRTVLETSGVDFARAYADACDTDSVADFRQQHAAAGLIVIDGVHTLSTKPRAARELCFQLDQYLALGTLVIVTSLTSPHELTPPGLASRLCSGLVVELALPSVETRKALLHHFAREKSIACGDDLIDHLAEQVRGSVNAHPSPRDLRGVLVQLDCTAKLRGQALDGQLVAEYLNPPAAPHAALDFKRILAVVAKRLAHTVDELRSSSRRKSLVQARGVAIVLGRKLTGESLQAIGKLLGNRDHSTIHHALESTSATIRSDAAWQQLLGDLEAELIALPPSTARTRRLPTETPLSEVAPSGMPASTRGPKRRKRTPQPRDDGG